MFYVYVWFAQSTIEYAKVKWRMSVISYNEN